MAKKIYYFLVELLNTIVSLVLVLFTSSIRCAIGISKRKEVLDEVHILANGSSLKNVIAEHVDFFAKRDTLVLNHFASSPVFWNIKPKYYVLLDPAYFGGLVSDELKARIPTLMDNLSKVDWPMILYIPYSKSVVKEASNRLNNPNISILPFNATRIIGLNAFRNFMYKQNLGLPSSKNVLLPSILLMLNKGYKKVYLYGAEFSWTKTYSVELESGNIYSDDTHFYDKTRIPLKKGGFKFDLSCMVESLSATEYLEDYSNSINANIVNRTVGSYIDAFSYENPNHVTFS